MLANAVCQSVHLQLNHRFCEQARSHIFDLHLDQGLCLLKVRYCNRNDPPPRLIDAPLIHF
ncbi:hypothetical protein BFW87_09165 [Pseudomonas fluorescens]|uniref:Uncharacterized protein n=1 Tax=Pseudomonas fluorescens TaxID=294 RepID=A0A1T2YVX2_PSEFL|nr:hypothetical protein BFW87_09165 [Pseudomonas fluorescens]